MLLLFSLSEHRDQVLIQNHKTKMRLFYQLRSLFLKGLQIVQDSLKL